VFHTCNPNPTEPTALAAVIEQYVLVVTASMSAAIRNLYEVPFRVLSSPTFSWHIVSEYTLKIEDLQGINILILYRCIQGSTLSLVRLAHLFNIKVIYELDDDLLVPPEDESWGLRYRTSHLSQIIKLFLAEVDLIKAGSPELAGRLKEKGFPVVYQPYSVKARDLSMEETGPPYRIGYFGSPHHQRDIEMIFPMLLAIKELLTQQVEFEFIGCYPQAWQQLKGKIFSYLPDYEKFLDFLTGRHWSLGLAPLRPTRFNAAKSNSKFRDYTAAGVVGIYTDLAPYKDSIIDGQNGWLVKDSLEEWNEIIKKALLCTGRLKMLQHARTLLQAAYSPETVARNWVTLFRDI
jgi:glycosyltransferase involved in cell wall biosynthesis